VALTYNDLTDKSTQMVFIFKILAFAALGIFILSLLHKMIGVEFIANCQFIYLSFALYPHPTYLANSIKSFSPVAGLPSIFYRSKYREMLAPFTEATEMSRQFLENTFVWTCLVAVVDFAIFFLALRRLAEERQLRGDTIERAADAKAICHPSRTLQCASVPLGWVQFNTDLCLHLHQQQKDCPGRKSDLSLVAQQPQSASGFGCSGRRCGL
jgi:hypothetical protein